MHAPTWNISSTFLPTLLDVPGLGVSFELLASSEFFALEFGSAVAGLPKLPPEPDGLLGLPFTTVLAFFLVTFPLAWRNCWQNNNNDSLVLYGWASLLIFMQHAAVLILLNWAGFPQSLIRWSSKLHEFNRRETRAVSLVFNFEKQTFC